MNFSIIFSKNMNLYLTILSLIIIIVPIEIYGEFPISIVDQKIFKSLNGDWNLIGVVQNNAGTPLEVKVGVNITKSINTSSILTSNTFSNVIYTYVSAPFKFIINSKEFFMDLTQKYSNRATHNEKALVGTIKNTGSNIIKNVSVYASVHSIDGTQIDSVKSTVIPVIYPYEETGYKIFPDSAIKDDVYFYSCAGLDVNAPISTLNIGNGDY